MFHYLTAMLWWRRAQVGFQRYFLCNEESFIHSFDSAWSWDFYVLRYRAYLWLMALEHVCVVIVHILLSLINLLKRRFNSNLLFLNLFISHLRILFPLCLRHRWLSCLRRHQSTILKHDVLHRWILTTFRERYFVLIV